MGFQLLEAPPILLDLRAESDARERVGGKDAFDASARCELGSFICHTML